MKEGRGGRKGMEVNMSWCQTFVEFHCKYWRILVCRVAGSTAGNRGKKKSKEYGNLCCQA